MAHASKLAVPLAQGRGDDRDETLGFYEREAHAYFSSTVKNDLSPLWLRFTARLRKGARILDAGSGSGRDTLHFLSQGFVVDAFDASASLAALSSRLTGQQTSVDTFEAWSSPTETYDGIWAFASLLHVARGDLPDAIDRLLRSLKPGGVFFASFKIGEGDTIDERGRRFTNFTKHSAEALFQLRPWFDRIEVWDEMAPAAHGEIAGWVYVLARRAPVPRWR